MNISGSTRLYSVIGSPVAHSLSPFIMNRAFALRHIDAVYTALEVPPDRAESVISGLAVTNAGGVNVTYPLKETAAHIATHRDPAVEVIGAANTLRFSNGTIEAFNSDAAGTARALEMGGVRVRGRRALIFGGGGAARAAAYGLLEADSGRATFAVRKPPAVISAVERLGGVFGSDRIDVIDIADADSGAFDIVINATPVGMHGVPDQALIQAGDVSPSQFYLDFVYHPRDTRFLRSARRGGAAAADGLALLVAQAAVAFTIWTGQSFLLPEMYAAVEARVDNDKLMERDD